MLDYISPYPFLQDLRKASIWILLWDYPKKKKGMIVFFVVVDMFSKMAHFLPCKSTKDASYIVDLFFKELVQIHGFSLNIVSDRDGRFVGHFWRTLWKKLGTNLSFSSAYNPQTNDQT